MTDSFHRGPIPNGPVEVQTIYQGSKEHEATQQELSNERFSLTTHPPVSPRSGESNEAFLKRHSRKCYVCHHPDRDAIEGAFVMWRRPKSIAETFQLRGDSLYRHAVAFDLFSRRRNSLRSVLDNILERGVETEITGETILGAVRTYACLDDNNRWIEPTTNVNFSTNRSPESPRLTANVIVNSLPEAIPSQSERSEPLAALTSSNRNSDELKIDVTH